VAYYLGSQYDRQSRRAVISQDIGQWDTPLPSLLGQDVLPIGEQVTDLAPALVAQRRARDYSWDWDLGYILQGQDAMAAGAQRTELPPRALPRARDYTITASFPLSLIGNDSMAAGEQALELPPKAIPRQRDYTWVQSASLPVFQEIPQGQRIATAELPPRSAARSRDYTQTASFPLSLIGQDQLPAGQQLGVNAPPGRPRAISLSETGVNLTALLTATAAVLPNGLSTALTELPPRATPRARDYTQAIGFPPELVGQDALTASRGVQELPPRGYARERDYTYLESFALQVFQELPCGQRVTDLPPRGVPRARDYSFESFIFADLIGQDAMAAGDQLSGNAPAGRPRAPSLPEPGINTTIVLTASTPTLPPGAQVSDSNVPRAPKRASEYGQATGFPLELIGKDQLPAGHSTDATTNPPRGAARSRDYTWLQSLPLYIFDQQPPGRSTDATALPPRGPQRARDYSYLFSYPQVLVGQDAMYGAPGEVPVYDWQTAVPPRGRTRARDYTWNFLVIETILGAGTPSRDLTYTVGAPTGRWSADLVAGRWSAGPPRQ